MASYKTEVIERLFLAKWDEKRGRLKSDVVTLSEVAAEIAAYNDRHPELATPISSRNPANFFKDIVRKRRAGSQMWPASVLAKGYTAVQETGSNACFRFVHTEEEVAFPPVRYGAPSSGVGTHSIESVSLPLASRRLGRRDEPWLVQVMVKLRVLESHFALHSPLDVIQLDHLQMSVKLSRTEIDALFLAVVQPPGEPAYEAIVCCEAKSKNEDLIEEQILRQVVATSKLRGVTQREIVPIAAKALGNSAVHVVEFAAVSTENAKHIVTLTMVAEAVYQLQPAVPGI